MMRGGGKAREDVGEVGEEGVEKWRIRDGNGEGKRTGRESGGEVRRKRCRRTRVDWGYESRRKGR